MDALLLARLNIGIVAAIGAVIGAVLAFFAGREVTRARREATPGEVAEALRQQFRAMAWTFVLGAVAAFCFALPFFGL
jgi:uncharacterized membrane protein YdjX (TVP38/TMEM64 family)